MSDDKIKRAYSRIVSLRDNLPEKSHYIRGIFAQDYNSIIGELEEETSSDLSEFKVPENEIKPKITSMNVLSGEKNYSSEPFCERTVIMVKINAILIYFTLKNSGPKEEKKMGFSIE